MLLRQGNKTVDRNDVSLAAVRYLEVAVPEDIVVVLKECS